MHATAEMVLAVGRRGMVVPVQLGAESSCICIRDACTDDSAAFLELEDWYNRRPLHASVDGLIDAWHKGRDAIPEWEASVSIRGISRAKEDSRVTQA